MKKALSISVTLVLISLATLSIITPKFIAPEHQKHVGKFIEKFNGVPGYSARISSTELSWFGSENNIVLDIDLSVVNSLFHDRTIQLNLNVDTSYGPFLFSSSDLFGWFKSDVKVTAEELRDYILWDEEVFYQASFVGGLANSVHYIDQFSGFMSLDKNLRVAAYHGEGEFVDNQINYKGHFEKVEMLVNQSVVEIDNLGIELASDAYVEAQKVDGFYNSVTEFSVESFKAGDDFSAEGISLIFESISNNDEQLSDVKMKYLVGRVFANDVVAESFVLETELNNISQSFLLKVQESQEGLMSTQAGEQEKALAFIGSHLDELLLKNPEFNITDLSLSIFNGEIKANVSSRFADIESPKLQDFLDKDALLYNLLAEARVKVDEKVLLAIVEKFLMLQTHGSIGVDVLKQEAKVMIEQFEDQGFIIKEGEHYYTELSLKDGEGSVNEFAFPL